jgi:hypothetical protein
MSEATTFGVAALLYGRETWIVKHEDKSRITATLMILETIIKVYMDRSKQGSKIFWMNWILNMHLLKFSSEEGNGLPRQKLPKLMTKHRSTGRRDQGRPLKRLSHNLFNVIIIIIIIIIVVVVVVIVIVLILLLICLMGMQYMKCLTIRI